MSPYTKNYSLDQLSIYLRRKNTFPLIFKKPLILNLILLSLIFVLLIFYLIQINQIITFGFKLNELEKRKEELEKINKSLQLEKIKLESLGNLQEDLTSFNFVKTEKVEYLKQITGGSLTQK